MTTETTQAPALPDARDAYATIFHGVHKRAYIQTLAERGHVAETEQDVTALMELGDKIARAKFAEAQKPTTSKFAQAGAAFDQLVGEKQADEGSVTPQARQIGWELAHDPQIYASALALKAAQAAAEAQEETPAQETQAAEKAAEETPEGSETDSKE